MEKESMEETWNQNNPSREIVGSLYEHIVNYIYKLVHKDSQIFLEVSKVLKKKLIEKDLAIVDFLRNHREDIKTDIFNIFSPLLSQALRTNISSLSVKSWNEIPRDLFKSTLITKSKKISLLLSTEYLRENINYLPPVIEKSNQRPAFSITKYISQAEPVKEYDLYATEKAKKEEGKEKYNKGKIKHGTKTVVRDRSATCQFLIPAPAREGYYKPCGIRLLEEETECPKHINQTSPEGEQWPYLCNFIISMDFTKGDPRTPKGLPCLSPCDKEKFRCKVHKKSINRVKENEEDEFDNNLVTRSFKVRLKLTKEQRQIYKELVGCCRKTRNWILENEGENCTKSLEELRKKYVYGTALKDKPYLKRCPKQIRDLVVKNFIVNCKNLKESNEKIQQSNQWKQERYEQQVKEYKELRKQGKKAKLPNKPKLTGISKLKFSKK